MMIPSSIINTRLLFTSNICMIDHVSVHVSDFAKAKEFYSKALAPLGYSVITEFAEWSVAGLGADGKPDLWIKADGAKQDVHVAVAAKDKQQVDDFYSAGMAAGGTDNGKPGYRKDYSPGYYAAFLKDSDGHNVEVVFHDPNPAQ
jgi:predicted lactoylglutathione lyase